MDKVFSSSETYSKFCVGKRTGLDSVSFLLDRNSHSDKLWTDKAANARLFSSEEDAYTFLLNNLTVLHTVSLEVFKVETVVTTSVLSSSNVLDLKSVINKVR